MLRTNIKRIAKMSPSTCQRIDVIWEVGEPADEANLLRMFNMLLGQPDDPPRLALSSQTGLGGAAVPSVQFDANVAAAEEFGSHQGAAGAAKRVEHHVPGPGECLDERH